MILVDTSIWIEVLRARRTLDLGAIVSFDEVVTCLPVIQEILQGVGEERAYRVAHDALFAMPIVESPIDQGVFVEAAGLYRTARSAGFTVRSSVDCLIAACALRNDLEVLHRDRDYEVLARVSRLKHRVPRKP